MTPRSLWALWGAALGLAATALALTAPGAAQANRRMDAELGQLRRATAHAEEIAFLRDQSPVWVRRRAPGTELATRIGEALGVAGLPALTLASLSPEAEIDAGGGDGLRAKRRRAVLTLAGVTLPKVGAFLAAWRELEGERWTVSGVDLIQDPSHRPPAGGGEVPLRATITLETLYVDDGGATRR